MAPSISELKRAKNAGIEQGGRCRSIDSAIAPIPMMSGGADVMSFRVWPPPKKWAPLCSTVPVGHCHRPPPPSSIGNVGKVFSLQNLLLHSREMHPYVWSQLRILHVVCDRTMTDVELQENIQGQTKHPSEGFESHTHLIPSSYQSVCCHS